MNAKKTKKIVVLATGGTIAGLTDDLSAPHNYQAGQVEVNALMTDVNTGGIDWVSEQLAQVDSKDMSFTLWQQLLERTQHWLAQDDVQGIVITGSMDIDRFGRDFDWSHFSIVCCGRYHVSLPFHTVRPNIFKAVKLVFTELMARGYRRIGFAMGRHSTAMEDDQARHGAAIALETSYLPKNRQLPVYSGLLDDIPSFLAWVEKCRPDVVVGFGMGYYWHLRDKGFDIPKDLGFASLHLLSQADKDLCAGLDQDALGIARQSLIFLDQLIRHRERGLPKSPLELLVPSVWNEGPSLRPRLKPS
jgi:hypothetical protein